MYIFYVLVIVSPIYNNNIDSHFLKNICNLRESQIVLNLKIRQIVLGGEFLTF